MNISRIGLRIIGLLLKEKKERYLREIARNTGYSTSSVSRHLTALKNSGILNERKQGKELLYSLNLSNVTASKLSEIVETQKFEEFCRKHADIRIILEDFLQKEKNEGLVNVTVFGSVAKGRFGKGSDIDILAVTDEKHDFGKAARKIYAEYGRNLSVVNLTKRELQEKKQEPLIQQIRKGHLIVFGYEYFIREVMADE